MDNHFSPGQSLQSKEQASLSVLAAKVRYIAGLHMIGGEEHARFADQRLIYVLYRNFVLRVQCLGRYESGYEGARNTVDG